MWITTQIDIFWGCFPKYRHKKKLFPHTNMNSAELPLRAPWNEPILREINVAKKTHTKKLKNKSIELNEQSTEGASRICSSTEGAPRNCSSALFFFFFATSISRSINSFHKPSKVGATNPCL